MTYQVRFTGQAQAELLELYGHILARDPNQRRVAERALEAIRNGMRFLRFSPFSCRKAEEGTLFLRELVIPFGSHGYVALFEIEDAGTVTVLAVRHQREDDYY